MTRCWLACGCVLAICPMPLPSHQDTVQIAVASNLLHQGRLRATARESPDAWESKSNHVEQILNGSRWQIGMPGQILPTSSRQAMQLVSCKYISFLMSHAQIAAPAISFTPSARPCSSACHSCLRSTSPELRLFLEGTWVCGFGACPSWCESSGADASSAVAAERS